MGVGERRAAQRSDPGRRIGPVRPFRVEVAQEQLDDLARRLAAARESSLPFADPSLGVDPIQLRALIAYWRDEFDWRRVEADLNRFDHVSSRSTAWTSTRSTSRGDGPDPLPVIINHGWPSSFAEFLPVTELLARPADHGGDAADAFDVVLPSLSVTCSARRRSSSPTRRRRGSRSAATA